MLLGAGCAVLNLFAQLDDAVIHLLLCLQTRPVALHEHAVETLRFVVGSSSNMCCLFHQLHVNTH